MEIDIERLKVGQTIRTFDAEEKSWVKVMVTHIGENDVTLVDLEGSMQGWTWKESLEALSDTEYYKPAK